MRSRTDRVEGAPHDRKRVTEDRRSVHDDVKRSAEDHGRSTRPRADRVEGGPHDRKTGKDGPKGKAPAVAAARERKHASPAQEVRPEPASARPDAVRAAPSGKRMALSNLGGETRCTGDASWFPTLRAALDVPDDPEVARYLTHAFHAWPARLHPHTARVLVRELSARVAPQRQAVVIDPFMGGGTVAVETMLAGHRAGGTDLNPIGREVAWVRTRRFHSRFLDGLDARLRIFMRLAREYRAESPQDRGLFERIGAWFDAHVLSDLAALNAVLAARLDEKPDDAAARVIRAALSSIVVKVSRQVSDSVTKADRDAARPAARPHPPGTVERWLGARMHELTGQLAAFAAAVPPDAPEADVRMCDARTPPRDLCGGAPVDVIVSSPPYLGVYDYVQHHLLRLNVLGFDARPLAAGELGSRREQRRVGDRAAADRYRDDLRAVLVGWRARMQPGGVCAWMIGDGQLGTAVLPMLPMLHEVARDAGWHLVASGSQARPAFIPGRREPGIKEEHLVLLQPSRGPR